MTSKTLTLTPKTPERFPIFPPREDMQNTIHLHLYSIITTLVIHYASLKGTLVHSELPVAPSLDTWDDYRIPDLIVVLDCDIELVYERRGYAIDRQGKPPDFALEVASVSTSLNDYTVKRLDYERYGVLEYWWFDPTGGEGYDAPLAADRLVDGKYEPIEIERVGEARWIGYSAALGLEVRWEYGTLRFYDPVTRSYLRGHYEEFDRAEVATRRAEAERRARLQSEIFAEEERQARLRSEALAEAETQRAERAEAELRRLRERLEPSE